MTEMRDSCLQIHHEYDMMKKDKQKFGKLKERWEKTKKEYELKKDDIIKKYRDYEDQITNLNFWKEYLSINN